ncbi:MAG TPA: metalloregulator ArsR/SmtB family transcription factor [Coriobacteriia bacterium]|jgi:ArsR family transcriptional regulator
MPTDQDERVDLVFRALASKPRREILKLLAKPGGAGDSRCCGDEVCACVFAERLGLSAPTVSHHMKALLDAGLVTAEKRGLWVYYHLNAEAFGPLMRELRSLASCADGSCG